MSSGARGSYLICELDPGARCLQVLLLEAYSIPDIIRSYCSHQGVFARDLAVAIRLRFFSVEGSIVVVA